VQIYYFNESFYLVSIALTKISILFFYLRIFPNPRFRRLVWFVIALCIGYILGFVIPVVFQCEPIRAAWQHWDGEHCEMHQS
jgi:hypothetical protein